MSADALVSVRAVGSALPADVLSAVVAGADGLGGLSADDYRLELGVSPREAANRAWSVLTSAYTAYRNALTDRPDGDSAVGLTREKWLAILLRELGFGRVPTTPAGGLVTDDRNFVISHVYDTDAGHVPIHLLGWGIELDKRTPGQPGAADRAPHAMVQEYLNRTDEALWGIVSNGRRLRLLHPHRPELRRVRPRSNVRRRRPARLRRHVPRLPRNAFRHPQPRRHRHRRRHPRRLLARTLANTRRRHRHPRTHRVAPGRCEGNRGTRDRLRPPSAE